MIVGCIADVGSILLTCLCFEFHIIGAAHLVRSCEQRRRQLVPSWPTTPRQYAPTNADYRRQPITGLPLTPYVLVQSFLSFRATFMRRPRSRCRQEDMLEYIAYALLALAMIGCVLYVLMCPEAEDPPRPKDLDSN
jgi:hypothetical protein